MELIEYERMFRVEQRHWWYQALHGLIAHALQRYLPDWRQRSILDAGCGTGGVLERLGHSPSRVGIDLSTAAIAFCRRRGLRTTACGDLLALPFADATFDAVISSSVLYHQAVVDIDRALLEMRRVLRPGGVLVLNLPAFAFLHSAHDEAVHTARRFTKREVRDLLRRHQFEIQALTYWTTLLFPAAFLARTARASRSGRDFEIETPLGAVRNRLLRGLMSLELVWLQHWPLPVGVALFAVARLPVDSPR